jgi:lipopolysaccharide export system protein LptC
VHRRDLWSLILLVSLAGASWWLANRLAREERASQVDEHAPDYWLEGLSFTTMGPDGLPTRRLGAERMIHYADDDSTELIEPVLSVFEGQRPPWNIRSESGWVSGDGELVLLRGEVRIERSEGEGVRPVEVLTRDLRVQPEQGYAETDRAVSAHSRRDWMQAQGMEVWFNGPVRIKLLSNVRGRYELN